MIPVYMINGFLESGKSEFIKYTIAQPYFQSRSTTLLILCEEGEVEYEEEGFGIPVIGTVRAGYNSLAYNDDFGYEYANVRNPDEYFYLIVRGDSMEPRIKDGDLALVHKQPTLNDGDLGVIVFLSSLTIVPSKSKNKYLYIIF